MMRVVNAEAFMSPLISFERISRCGTNSTSRTLSKENFKSPSAVELFWATMSVLPLRSVILLA